MARGPLTLLLQSCATVVLATLNGAPTCTAPCNHAKMDAELIDLLKATSEADGSGSIRGM